MTLREFTRHVEFHHQLAQGRNIVVAFVLDRVQALSFIPIPDQLLHYLVQKAPPGLLTYYAEDRIMVVNLNDWMPPGVDLSLVVERDRIAIGKGKW